MLAQVQLLIGTVQSSTFVAKDAIVLGGESPTVFILKRNEKGGGTVQPVTVELGATDGALIEVIDKSGTLKPGIEVVVEGNERLRPNSEVRVLASTDK